MPLQAASKGLHHLPANSYLPSPGLQIDGIRTEPLLFDDAIDSAIAASPHRLSSIFARASIACSQQRHHKMLKE
jgi:hypothetical protein